MRLSNEKQAAEQLIFYCLNYHSSYGLIQFFLVAVKDQIFDFLEGDELVVELWLFMNSVYD
jgi:hypothetical protein